MLQSFQFSTVMSTQAHSKFLQVFYPLCFGKLTSLNRYSTDLCLPSTAAGMGYERAPLKIVLWHLSIPGIYSFLSMHLTFVWKIPN